MVGLDKISLGTNGLVKNNFSYDRIPWNWLVNRDFHKGLQETLFPRVVKSPIKEQGPFFWLTLGRLRFFAFAKKQLWDVCPGSIVNHHFGPGKCNFRRHSWSKRPQRFFLMPALATSFGFANPLSELLSEEDSQNLFPLKTNMCPEHQWLENAFPPEIVPF